MFERRRVRLGARPRIVAQPESGLVMFTVSFVVHDTRADVSARVDAVERNVFRRLGSQHRQHNVG
jgi:hypothetical protein